MKKLLLTALLCFSINGFAYNWKKVGESIIGDTLYVDTDSIKKTNDAVYFWSLMDYLEPSNTIQITPRKMVASYSLISKYKVDCKENKLTNLSSTSYTGQMAKGRVINESMRNSSSYPKPHTFIRTAMEFVCNNAK